MTLAACPACSAVADGFNGFAVHLEHHDVAMIAVSRAPIARCQAYKRRMGWTFTWVSSLNSDFNYDFNTSFTEECSGVRAVSTTTTARSTQKSSTRHLANSGDDRHRRPHLYPRGSGHERVRSLRRRRLPYLHCICTRPGRALGDVPVALTGRRKGVTKPGRGSGGATSTPEILDSGRHAKQIISCYRIS